MHAVSVRLSVYQLALFSRCETRGGRSGPFLVSIDALRRKPDRLGFWSL